MLHERLRSARLVALFLLGCLGFTAPLLRLASGERWLAGLPFTWVYLYGLWALLILLIAVVVRPRGE